MHRSIDYYTNKTISDVAIRARMDHFNQMQADERPEDPPLIVEDGVTRMRSLPSSSVAHIWVLRQGDRITAQCCLDWTEQDTNREAAGIAITVEPGLRQQGIGSQFLRLALKVASGVNRSLLFSGSNDRAPAGRSFLEHAGFAPKFEVHINQLEIDRLDTELMANWHAAGRSQSKNYVIELWDGPVPDTRLDAFAELANVMNDAPSGELDIEDTKITPERIREQEECSLSNGSRQLIACVQHLSSKELVGYTELSWNPKRATIARQGDTGVLEAHRNCGLGRWLKAANMDALLRENPAVRFVRTGNADSNAPMLAINRKMGFVPFIAETVWQGRAVEIADRMSARHADCVSHLPTESLPA